MIPITESPEKGCDKFRNRVIYFLNELTKVISGRCIMYNNFYITLLKKCIINY